MSMMSSKKDKEAFLLRDREAEESVQLKPRYVSGPPPGDQLYMSVFTVFCCFMPFGIIALIKSLEAQTAHHFGRHEEAAIAVRSARTFNRWSIIVGIILKIVALAVLFGFIAYAMNSFKAAVAAINMNPSNNGNEP